MNATIEYKGAELEVEYDFTPAVGAILFPVDEATPPEPQEASVDMITIGGVDVMDLLEDQINDIEEAILEQNHSII